MKVDDHAPLLLNVAEDLTAAAGQPIKSLFIQLDRRTELFLVLKQLRHVDVNVPDGSVVPLELCHGLLQPQHNVLYVQV